MTIEGLLAATGLTANDLVPIWDAEAAPTVEPTQKITAAQFAAAVKVLADLQGKLTFDSTPTTGSTNPVTSGGVAEAIQQSTAFFVAVDTLAELESALVTKWSAMSNGGSIQGSVWTTFSDASKGFNSGVYTVALFRRLSGVYLATFITTTATVISDYYYSDTHHWSSQLSDKAVVSALSGAASGVTTLGNYVYDPSIRTVRIYCASRSTSDMGPSTVLANIPAAYRPKSTVYLVGFYTTAGSGVAYQGRVETNGNVTQMLGSSVREAIIVGEYSID